MPEVITISGLDDDVGQTSTPSSSPLVAVAALAGSLIALSLLPRLISALRGEEQESDT